MHRSSTKKTHLGCVFLVERRGGTMYVMTLRLTLFFSTLLTLAIVHIAASTFFLYWRYFWLDLPMHMLGGVCVVFGLSILPFFRIHLPRPLTTFWGTLVLVLAVGITWEIFEMAAHISVLPPESVVVDTSVDFLMDLLGGALGFCIIKMIKDL